MDRLLAAVYDLVIDQHPNKINALSSAICRCDIDDASTLNNYFATDAANNALAIVLQEWRRLGCTSAEVSGIVRGASYGQSSEKEREQVQLVWTGPDLNLTPVRRSEQILLELIDSAEHSIFIVTFVVVNIPRVEDAIRRALDRGVDVRMLLESEGRDGSGTFGESIERLYADIPGLTIYVWPRDRRENIEGGFARVHAKCAVADKCNAFLTSANLTSAALDKNIEMGVHIQGGGIPPAIYHQLVGMIRSNEISLFVPNRYLANAKTEPVAVSIGTLADNLKVGTEIFLSFRNSELHVDEKRLFSVLGVGSERPRQNSLVVIRRDGRWLVGKYAWSKQQDTHGGRIFYLVTVRGYARKQSFEVEEQNWKSFMPAAVETTGSV